MQYNDNILPLVEERKMLQSKLDGLVYGAPEIRTVNNSKYLYVSYREDGKKSNKYVGEYSDELYSVILSNNEQAKAIKKSLKELDKKLADLGYDEVNLSEKTKTAIDFAKKNIVTSINGQAVLEGIATTTAETEDIIAGLRVAGITDEDAHKIVNLKHAWDFILNEQVITVTQDFGLLCQINKLVEEGFYYNAGKIRNVPVKIGGTDWRPILPVESQIKEELDEILSKKSSKLDIALDLLLYVMKKQIFIDGNKRTALIFANHYLISKGKGVLFINDSATEEYKNLLVEFYETGTKAKIVEFLKKSFIAL